MMECWASDGCVVIWNPGLYIWWVLERNIRQLAVIVQLYSLHQFDLITDQVWGEFLNLLHSFRMVSYEKLRDLVMYPTCPGRARNASHAKEFHHRLQHLMPNLKHMCSPSGLAGSPFPFSGFVHKWQICPSSRQTELHPDWFFRWVGLERSAVV